MRLRALLSAIAAIVLSACTAKDIIVTNPVSFEVKITKVTGSKVIFQVNPSNKDACYTCTTVSESQDDYDRPELEVAKDYISYLGENYDDVKERIGSFSDFACYRGSRQMKITYISRGTKCKLLVFQVNPVTREVLGEVYTEYFRTADVNMQPLSFTFAIDNNTLVITPSDPERTYFWSYDRQRRIEEARGNSYFYLYEIIDMYETYGFTEHMISKGEVTYDIDPESLWADERYLVAAIGYSEGEIDSDVDEAFFACTDGQITLLPNYDQQDPQFPPGQDPNGQRQ